MSSTNNYTQNNSNNQTESFKMDISARNTMCFNQKVSVVLFKEKKKGKIS